MTNSQDFKANFDVLDNMIRLGDSFAAKLAKAWKEADLSNSRRLYESFGDLYHQYDLPKTNAVENHHRIVLSTLIENESFLTDEQWDNNAEALLSAYKLALKDNIDISEFRREIDDILDIAMEKDSD